jgi:cell division protease FtsH
MVEVCGMGGGEVVNLRQFWSVQEGKRLSNLSEEQLILLDRQVNKLICEARERAAGILRDNRALLEALRDMLVEKKTIEAATIKSMMAPAGEKKPRKARTES